MATDDPSTSQPSVGNIPMRLLPLEARLAITHAQTPISEIVETNENLARRVLAAMGEITVEAIAAHELEVSAGSFGAYMFQKAGVKQAATRLFLALEQWDEAISLPERVVQMRNDPGWLASEASGLLGWGINRGTIEL